MKVLIEASYDSLLPLQSSSPEIEAMQDLPHHTHHWCKHCLAHHSICFGIVCVVLQGDSFHFSGSNAAQRQFGRFKSVGDNLLKSCLRFTAFCSATFIALKQLVLFPLLFPFVLWLLLKAASAGQTSNASL